MDIKSGEDITYQTVIDACLQQEEVLEALAFWIDTDLTQKELIEVLKYRKGEYTTGPVSLKQKAGTITEDKTLNDGYYEYQERKKTGGYRTIVIPCDPLKIMQTKIEKQLRKIPISLASFGGEGGKSAEKNIKIHKNTIHDYVVTTDIKDFYPSISAGRVKKNIEKSLEKLFSFSFPYLTAGQKDYFIHALTILLTYNDELPQGSPCSPRIANIISASMDGSILSYIYNPTSNIYKPQYTRYIDDMTVSRKGFKDTYILQEQLQSMLAKISEYNANEMPTAEKKFEYTNNLCEKAFAHTYLIHDQETKEALSQEWKQIRTSIEYQRDGADENLWHKYYILIGNIDMHVSQNILKQPLLNTAKEVEKEIKKHISDKGFYYNQQKTTLRTPNSPGIREVTGYTITDKGTIGIPKEKMEKYLTFLECVDETPELLPIVYKIGTGIHEFVLDIPKILASLKGIKQFVETHRDHIPAKFMKHYTAVLQKYDSLQ